LQEMLALRRGACRCQTCDLIGRFVRQRMALTMSPSLPRPSCVLLPILTRASGPAPERLGPCFGPPLRLASATAAPAARCGLSAGIRVDRVRGLSAQTGDQAELGEPKIVSKSKVGATRWLELVKLNWQDDRGRKREWDAVERPFPTDAGAPLMAPQASAVAILPILRIDGRFSEVILISQYRPPLGSMCIEAPAGLVGAGEDYTDTAFRELFEETGLRAASVLDDDDAVLCNDPGITNAACRLLVVEVDADAPENAAALNGIESGAVYGLEEEGESIRLWRLPLAGLRTELNQKMKEGYAVDGKLHCFARGLAMSSVLS